MSSKSKMACGRIVMMQEQSFRLVTDEGEMVQLTLGVYATPSAADLESLYHTGRRVAVEYTGAPNTTSATALAVRPL